MIVVDITVSRHVALEIDPREEFPVCICFGHPFARVYLTFEELADIADAAQQHLEIESAAEYLDFVVEETDEL